MSTKTTSIKCYQHPSSATHDAPFNEGWGYNFPKIMPLYDKNLSWREIRDTQECDGFLLNPPVPGGNNITHILDRKNQDTPSYPSISTLHYSNGNKTLCSTYISFLLHYGCVNDTCNEPDNCGHLNIEHPITSAKLKLFLKRDSESISSGTHNIRVVMHKANPYRFGTPFYDHNYGALVNTETSDEPQGEMEQEYIDCGVISADAEGWYDLDMNQAAITALNYEIMRTALHFAGDPSEPVDGVNFILMDNDNFYIDNEPAINSGKATDIGFENSLLPILEITQETNIYVREGTEKIFDQNGGTHRFDIVTTPDPNLQFEWFYEYEYDMWYHMSRPEAKGPNGGWVGDSYFNLTVEPGTETKFLKVKYTNSRESGWSTILRADTSAPAELNFLESAIDINSEGGDIQIHVESNRMWNMRLIGRNETNTAWYATLNIDGSDETYNFNNVWAYIVGDYPYEGGNKTLTLRVLPNNTGLPRTGTLKLLYNKDYSDNDIVDTLIINQSHGSLDTSTSSLCFNSTDSPQTITIESNEGWTITDNVNWIDYSETSGTGNATITVDPSENTSVMLSRAGTITITSDSGIVEHIYISQAAAIPYLDVSPTSLSSPYTGLPITFTIESNDKWLISDNVSWISYNTTIGTGDMTITVDPSKNYNESSRSGVITITSNMGIVKTINITQYGKRIVKPPTDISFL